MTPSPPQPYDTVRAAILAECVAMTRYLLSSGAGVSADLVAEVERYESADGPVIEIGAMSITHQRLSRLVHPAKPASIVYLLDYAARHPSRNVLGTIPIVRQVMGLSLACLVVFISLGVFQHVAAIRNGALVGSPGLRVFLGEIFWMSAAGLGASFATLFQLNQQIATRTYDPATATWHWVRVTLGVIAGFVLVALVPVEGMEAPGAQVMAKPALAMLGGFSASVVYMALNRLVDAVESMFRPDSRLQTAAGQRARNAELEQGEAEARLSLAVQLRGVQEKLAAGRSPEAAVAELRGLVERLLPSGTAFGDRGTASSNGAGGYGDAAAGAEPHESSGAGVRKS